MLSTFTAAVGRKAGVVYHFPTSSTEAYTNRRRDTYQPLSKADGVYVTSGTAPMPLDAGNFDMTFDLTLGWLKTNANTDYYNGTNDDNVATWNAVLDFIVSVVEGGLGTLTWTLHTGVKDPVSGVAITGFTAPGQVHGDITVTHRSSFAQIQANFGVPSGTLKASTGQIFAFG